MADEDNPFASLGPAPVSRAVAQAGMTVDQPDRPDDDNPFAQFGSKPVAPTGSFTGAVARGAVRGVTPAAGGLVGAGEGAALGALVPGLGETGLSELVGGVIGGFAGAYGAGKTQDYALSKAPDSWVDALGQSDRQQRLDQEQHPYGSFFGGMVPFALTMTPFAAGGKAAELPENATNLRRLMANPATARVFGGAMMGGVELAQEEVQDRVDWGNVAIATGFGMVFNRPNPIGEAIENVGPRAFGHGTAKEINAARAQARARAGMPNGEPNIFPQQPDDSYIDFTGLDEYEHRPPTLAEANAYGVGGPGATEQTFMGSHMRDPTAQAAADAALREENATIGPMDKVDVDALARRSERDLFGRYDALRDQRDAFADQMRSLRAPDDEETQSAQQRVADAQAAYDAHLEKASGYKGGPDARRLRAELRDAQRQADEVAARKVADNSEAIAAATAQYQATDYALRDLGPTVGAARRRAAERAGSEMVQPVAVETEPENVVAKPQAAAVTSQTPTLAEIAAPPKTLAEQKAAIAEDVKRKVIAAGRPADQAQDVGTLVANHFAVLASQFKGALGTALDWYRREGPEWRGPKGEKALGAEPSAGNGAPAAEVPTGKPGTLEALLAAKTEADKAAGPPPVVAAAPVEPPAAKETKGKVKGKAESKISAADARAKAESFGVSNLIDGLQAAGATSDEIADVIGKKLTVEEIAALERAPVAPRPTVKTAAKEKTGAPVEGARAKADRLEISNLIDRLGASGASAEDISGVIGGKLSLDEIGEILREGPRARKAAEPAPKTDEPSPTETKVEAPASSTPTVTQMTGSAIGRFVDQVAVSPKGVPALSGILLREPELVGAIREAAEGISVQTEHGPTRVPDADHAALFEVGRRLATGDKMESSADVHLLRRLLERFKGFVIEEPDYETHFETARDVEHLATEYYQHATRQAEIGRPAGDMLADDEARKDWSQRIIREIAENARSTPLEPVRAASQAIDRLTETSVADQRAALPKFTTEASAAIPADDEGRDQPVGVFMFDPRDINVDASRFQFKSGGDKYGVTGALRSVKKWDRAKAQAIIVWEDLKGKLWVADGHQRSGLARRLTEQGMAKDIQLPGLLYREKDGISAEDVRAIAAVTNIANGSGSAIDGAKILRARPELLDGSVPLSAGKGAQAAALASLGDEAFRVVVNDVVPEHFGAIVGQIIPRDEARQLAAIKAIARFEPKSVEEATALTQRVAESELAKAEEGRQQSFFGDLESADSTAGEEMRIVGSAIKGLKRDKALFARVVANAERIEESGSRIERGGAQSVASDAELFARRLSSDAYTAGPVRDALTLAARNLKDGKASIADAASSVLASLRSEAEKNVAGRAGDLGRAAEPETKTGAERGPEGTQQTLIPGVAPVTERERIEAAAAKPLTGGNADMQHEGLFGDAKDQADLFQRDREKFGGYDRGEPRGVIHLFSSQNASTPIHELGHDFLERMRRYGNHELAPEQLRKDWQTIKRALKIDDADVQIKRPAHEQFARWFEQYLHEGMAPSAELAGVFSRFKNWMANIYKNVRDIFDRRQIPMNADVRAVFDRMLSEEPRATVIAPQPARAPTLVDLHTAEAARVEPAQALPAAERIAAERAEAVAPPEVEHEIAPTLAEIEAKRTAAGSGGDAAGEAGRGDGGLPEVVGGGGQTGAQPGGGKLGTEPSPERQGGNDASAEGGGVSGGPTAGQPAAGRSESGGTAGGKPLAPEPVELLTPPKRFIDKAGNLRLDNVNGVEDLKTLAREIAESNKGFVGDRRAPLSDAEVMRLQESIGDDRVTRKTLGEASNAEEGLAIQRIAAQAWRDMHDAAQTFKQSRSDADLFAYIEKQQRATMMQAYYSQATAEAGRALRAMRKVQEFWSPGAEVAKATTEGAPKPTPSDVITQATGQTLFQKAQEALLVAEYENPQSAARFNSWTRRHSFGRCLLEYWVNGLISGTATHTTYLVGNALLALNKGLLETPMAAAIGATRGMMGRQTGNVVQFGETAARLRGAVSGFAPAAQAAAETLRTGVTGQLPGHGETFRLPFQPESAPPTEGAPLNERATMQDAKVALYGASRGILDGILSIGKILEATPEGSAPVSAQYSALGAIPDLQIRGGVLPVGQVLRAPSRAVATIHTFMRAMNYSMEKNAAVYRQALAESEGAGWSQEQLHARIGDLTNNTPEQIVDSSSTAATELTLMGPAGEFTRRISAITNWAPNLPLLGETPILKFIDPFVHIASNIVDQTFVQRTPLGLLSGEVRRDLFGRNGVAAQDMAQARMIVGSALALGFGALASRGVVTGSGPIDKSAARAWRLAGYQPHSVLIGSTWYQMNRLGPLGMLLGTAADLYDVAHAASKEDMLQVGNLLARALYQNVLDESFMRGPADLIQAIDDPGRYGERWIQGFASSFVPYSVGLSQITRASDPYAREARTVMDSIRQKIPGLSESLLPRLDIWGQPIPSRDALIAAGLTAIYEQRMSTDPVNIALNDIGVGFGAVERSIRNVKLTDQQYDDFARFAGRMAKMRLDTIVNSPDWRTWPPGVQAMVAKETVEQSRESARNLMFVKYPQIFADSTKLIRQKTFAGK